MSFLRLIYKSIWFFRKQHLAVLLGTVISTAVLTGALIIGDSVKLSLQRLVDIRLGEVKYAMQTGDRFVRSYLANDISNQLNTRCTPLLNLTGVAINPETNNRINSINVLGVQPGFWSFSKNLLPDISEDCAIISENVAERLNLKAGDEFIIRVENADVIPINAPFARDSKPSIVLGLRVKTIAGDDQLGRFSLKSNQAAPYNVFVNLEYLAEKLDITGKINTLLVAGNDRRTLNIEELNKCLERSWNISDAGIIIQELPGKEKIEILSDRIFIDAPVANVLNYISAQKATILTYLVNSIRFNGNETPYSFVTAASEPYFPADFGENEIIINKWLADDLRAKKGDTLLLDYYVIGPMRTLKEKSKSFVVRDVIKTETAEIDNTLMPNYPGLMDAGNCRDWDTGIPIDLERIRDKDEKYWNDFRGSPKAVISIETGKDIWSNDFGSYTAFRFSNKEWEISELERHILDNLNPPDLNLAFRPVYQEGKDAATNSVDFGELFLSLSFFVIAAGVLLTLLLYGLSTESRKEETGILSALGFSKKQIICFRFAEYLLVIFFGSFAGAALGIIYNYGIIAGLNSVWNDVVRTQALEVFIFPKTLVTGALSGAVIGMIMIVFVTSRKLKQTLSSLLKADISFSKNKQKKNHVLTKILIILGIFGAIVLSVYAVINSADQNAMMFMTAGALFLLGSVSVVSLLMSLNRKSKTVQSLFMLSLTNAGRNKARSITTVTLLALGVFTIIITGANRKTFYGVENNRQSGTGGFLFWAETSLPVIYDLNSETGKTKLGLDNEESLNRVEFEQLFTLDGDDASCLNLNQVQQPRILGIDPQRFDVKQVFSFARLLNEIDKSNPWLGLEAAYQNNVIPAYADQTVITWGLMKKVGDTLLYFNEHGEEIKLLLTGGLNNSIFQGNILISKDNFKKHFPSVAGSKVMLIDAPKSDEAEVSELIQNQLQDLGIDMSLTSERLAEFNSVTNTYLSVFMALGGLGVIIGTVGLGIVLLRNMLDRKQELAILLAIGYEKKQVFWLVFYENLVLLSAGMLIGILSAIIGILPSILSPAFTIPGLFLLLLTALVFCSGLLWIYMPVKQIMKGNLIVGLRNE